jgi:hypothetical protein
MCTHVTRWEVLRGVEARDIPEVTKPKSGNVVKTAGVGGVVGLGTFLGKTRAAGQILHNRGDVSRHNGRRRRIKEGAPQLEHVLESKNIGLHARLRIFDD